jgi:hypothetical protein
MNNFLPPSVTPLVEEPMAAGGVQTLRMLEGVESGNTEPKSETVFTAAHDAIG